MKTVLVPSAEILIQFNRVADALFEQIELRLQNNVLLAEARDRVLPKLMSGEIEVK